MGKIILVSGAARSGKSVYAEKLVENEENVAYLATAQALDLEMEERIKNHCLRRPVNWQTFEEPIKVYDIIEAHYNEHKIWLLDCITLWISNLMISFSDTENLDKGETSQNNEGSDFISEGQLLVEPLEKYVLREIRLLIQTVNKYPITLIAVTNEVGWGLVPPDPISRAYRDMVGKANQLLAASASEVTLVALGLPLKLKP